MKDNQDGCKNGRLWLEYGQFAPVDTHLSHLSPDFFQIGCMKLLSNSCPSLNMFCPMNNKMVAKIATASRFALVDTLI